MSTPKFAQNVLKIVTLVGVCAFAQPGQAQMLDLGKLATNLFRGTDNNRKNTCVLDVGKPGKDFVNRRIQTFDVKTLSSDLNMSMLMTGGQNDRAADFKLGNGKVQFNIPIDDNRLEIVASETDTQNISLFRLWGKTFGNDEGLIIECVNVQTYPR